MKIKFRENACKSGDAHVLLIAYNEEGDTESALFNRALPFENFRRRRAMKKLTTKMQQLYSDFLI